MKRRALLLFKPFRWAWAHKLRSMGYVFSTLVLAYSVVFVLVSCAQSPTTQRIQLPDQRTLAYNQHAGGGPDAGRVILIHGAPADASSWTRLLKRSKDIRAAELFVIDRIGYGNSTLEDDLTLAGHAASVQPLLIDTNNIKPIIVGHSYGGPVALRLAAEFPDQISGIVLIAGACDAYMQDAQGFRRLVDGGKLFVPEPWERANRELLALTDENRAMEPMLDKVICPVVIVHGTWDRVCPHDSTIAYLQKSLVNAEEVRVVSIERGGHNLQLSEIDTVIDAINHLAPSP